jgi:hypothetical protein
MTNKYLQLCKIHTLPTANVNMKGQLLEFSSSLGIKQPERDADYSPPSGAEIYPVNNMGRGRSPH